MVIVNTAIGASGASTEDWEAFVGQQVRAVRIRANLEQLDLAKNAEVSVGALRNLEGGRGCTLRTLVKVLRALGRTDWLEALAPPVSVSPMQMLRAPGLLERKKVFRPRTRKKAP